MELPGKPTDAFLEGTQRKVEDKDSLSRNSRINNNGFMVEVDTFENRDEWVRDRLLPLAAAVNMYHGNEIGIHIHLRLYFVRQTYSTLSIFQKPQRLIDLLHFQRLTLGQAVKAVNPKYSRHSRHFLKERCIEVIVVALRQKVWIFYEELLRGVSS